jgi:hypothetical protein
VRDGEAVIELGGGVANDVVDGDAAEETAEEAKGEVASELEDFVGVM